VVSYSAIGKHYLVNKTKELNKYSLECSLDLKRLFIAHWGEGAGLVTWSGPL